MYEAHFGLKKPLFQTGIAQDSAVFLAARHQQLAASIKLALATFDSAVVLTGPAGVGKTALIASALRATSTKLALGWITVAPANAAELLELLLVEFGFNAHRVGRVERMQMWRQFLNEMSATSSRVYVIAERAEDLGAEVLRALDSLTAPDPNGSLGANLVLLGQPALLDVLKAPALACLCQRIRLRQRLEPLALDELRAYLDHHASAAGSSLDKLFARDALAALHDVTGGIPRVVNNVAETALTLAATRKLPAVTAQLVREVAQMFGIAPAPAPTAAVASPPGLASGVQAARETQPATHAAPSIAVAANATVATVTASAVPAVPRATPEPPTAVRPPGAQASPVAAQPSAILSTSMQRAAAPPSANVVPAPLPIAPQAAAATAPANTAPVAAVRATLAAPPTLPVPAAAAAPAAPGTPATASAPATPSAAATASTAESKLASTSTLAPRAPLAATAASSAPAAAPSLQRPPAGTPPAAVSPQARPASPGTGTGLSAAGQPHPATHERQLMSDEEIDSFAATLTDSPDVPMLDFPVLTDAVEPARQRPRTETAYVKPPAARAAAPEAPKPAAPLPRVVAAATAAPIARPVKPPPPAMPSPAAVSEDGDVLRQTQTMRAISVAKSIDDISNSMAETLFGDADLSKLSSALGASGWTEDPAPAGAPPGASTGAPSAAAAKSPAQPMPGAKPAPPPADDDDPFDFLGLGRDAPLELIDEPVAPQPRKEAARNR